jgi:hypothetical protein
LSLVIAAAGGGDVQLLECIGIVERELLLLLLLLLLL